MKASRKRYELACAAAAAFVFVAAVSGPLDRLSDASFAWHMLQHLLLLFIVPALALAAHPLEWFGSPRARWRRAAIRVLRSAPVRTLCSPPAALLIFIAVLWGVHFTPLYEAALEHPLVHAGEHLLLLATGILFWIPVFAPPPLPVPSYPVRVLYLFIALPQAALLSFALLAARAPLYAHYAGPNALADQHNAAAVMWVGGGAIVFTAFLLLIGRWAARERYAVLAFGFALVAADALLRVPAGAASTQTPPYTAEQARLGQTLFYEHCAECHGDMMEGHYGPALRAPDGNLQWESVQYVFQYMTGHMPVGDADGLTAQQYLDLMAYIISQHHHAPATQPLTATAANASKALLGP
jgi:cytochrome c oxidase assembly factor CtaG